MLADDAQRPNLVADLSGAADGPTLCFLGHVDTVLADPSRLAARPVVGPRRGRLPVGSRLDRHEVAGRGRGRGRGDPSARRVAAGPGPPDARVRLRRGDRRRRRRAVADRAASGKGPLRHAAQRGRRSVVRSRRPPTLRGLLRREGDLPLPGDRPRSVRPRLGSPHRRQRAAEARPDPAADRPGAAVLRARQRPRGNARGARRGPGAPWRRAGADRRGRPGVADADRADVRRHADADDGPRLRQDQRDPRERVAEDRLPGAAGAGEPRRPVAGSTRCSASTVAI